MPFLSRIAASQLYRPKRCSRATVEEQVARLPFAAKLLPLQDAIEIEPMPGTGEQGTAVLFHGNKGSAVTFAYRAQPFISRGWRVVMAEYRGYGSRTGRPSEEALVEDALELLEWVRANRAGPLLLVGKSLGSGVAVQAAVRMASAGHSPAHLMLITPYLSIAHVAEKWFPRALVRLMLKDRYDSHQHLQGYEGLVTVVVALKDKVTEPAQGLALADIAAKRGPMSLLSLPDAAHTDWFAHMLPAQWDSVLSAKHAS